MAPKKPKQSGSKASGQPASPAQYAKGMTQLKSLLKKAERGVSELAQTTDFLAEQIAALRNIVAANGPLAEKLANEMEKISQSATADTSSNKVNRKNDAPSGKHSQSKRSKTSKKPTPKIGKRDA